jgi:hypothetical protein
MPVYNESATVLAAIDDRFAIEPEIAARVLRAGESTGCRWPTARGRVL